MTSSRLTLPTELIPADGRFGCGPSKVRAEQLHNVVEAGRTIMGTSHRQAAVRTIVGDLREGLSTLFSLPDGYEVVLSLGGATAFWDAAIYGLIEQRSGHFTCGEFSSKFAKAAVAAPWLDEPMVVAAEPGTVPQITALTDVDVLAWAHNETSTGAMMPVTRPEGTVALTVIDATSGAGGLPVDISQADAYYFSPQKCFASDGGLWFAAVSPRAIERIERLATTGRYIPAFLNLHTALVNSRKNQTYNTPAIASLLMMRNQVQWMNNEGGLDAMVARTAEHARIVYGWAESRSETRPYVTDPANRSLVVATIDINDTIDATALTAILRANNVVDIEPYRKLGRNQVRIGMFPTIDTNDLVLLTRAIDYVLDSGAAHRDKISTEA